MVTLYRPSRNFVSGINMQYLNFYDQIIIFIINVLTWKFLKYIREYINCNEFKLTE
jgi:hypothetical protein